MGGIKLYWNPERDTWIWYQTDTKIAWIYMDWFKAFRLWKSRADGYVMNRAGYHFIGVL